MTQLHRQRGTLLAGVAAGWDAPGLSLQQQHPPPLMAAAAAAAAAMGGGAGAAWVPSSSSGVRTSVATSSELETISRLSQATTGTAAAGSGGSGVSTPHSAGAAAAGGASGSSAGAGVLAEEQAAALQGLLLDASGKRPGRRPGLCQPRAAACSVCRAASGASH